MTVVFYYSVDRQDVNAFNSVFRVLSNIFDETNSESSSIILFGKLLNASLPLILQLRYLTFKTCESNIYWESF